MNISLEEAIHIHARVLVRRKRVEAPESARDRAKTMECLGDSEGRDVWLRVAEAAEQMVAAQSFEMDEV